MCIWLSTHPYFAAKSTSALRSLQSCDLDSPDFPVAYHVLRQTLVSDREARGFSSTVPRELGSLETPFAKGDRVALLAGCLPSASSRACVIVGSVFASPQ